MHGTHFSRELPRWLVGILAVLFLLTVIVGTYGHLQYKPNAPGRQGQPSTRNDTSASDANSSLDFWSAVYYSLQLPIMHGAHLEGPVPTSLTIGRFFGFAFFVVLAFSGILIFLPHRVRHLRLNLPWRRNHVVICGLGDLGLRLALDGRRRGKFVVAIENENVPAAVEQARASGVLVIEGDARELVTLRRARVDQAAFVIAACQADETNIAIAAHVGQVLPTTPVRNEPLVCRLLVRDPQLRKLLTDESLFPVGTGMGSGDRHSNYRLNFGDLNLYSTAARQCLRKYPLDFQPIRQEDDTVVHLIVVGFGPMGESLALHAARIGHFANEAPPRNRQLRITVVHDAEEVVSAFRERTQIDDVCELHFQKAERRTTDLVNDLDQLSRNAAEPKSLVTYAVCLEKEKAADDAENLRIGIELSRRVQDRAAQVLIFQNTRRGLAALFPDDARGAGLSPRLHAFGMVEDIFNWDVLLHESEDQLARALHEDYLEQRRRKGEAVSTTSEWARLPESLKDSNRRAADHIDIKLRAMGYHHECIQPGKERKRFVENEIRLLAQMEHLRWCAEKRLDGWRHGEPRDDAAKVHDCLLPWDQLPPKQQIKDPEQINAIPRVLEEFDGGHGIYR
jgi:hypothetical protein